MKNIHVLPTDKSSRLYLFEKRLILGDLVTVVFKNSGAVNQHIYITSDEEIKEGDYAYHNIFGAGKIVNVIGEECFVTIKQSQKDGSITTPWKRNFPNIKKIILTTDEDLIKDGVQEIEDDFLEWFVKHPSCEEVSVVDDTLTVKEMSSLPLGTRNHKYKIIIPKEEPKQDLEKEMFELEQELDIPSHLRWHNSKPKQETTLEEVFDISMLKEYLLDFVDWQNRCSKWVTIPESMVDDYLDWKKFKKK